MSDNSSDSVPKKQRWSGKLIALIPLMLVLALAVLSMRACSESRSTGGGTSSSGTSVSSGQAGGQRSSQSTVVHYELEVPKGDTITMPSKASGEWSATVHGRGGFRIYLDADRGGDSFDTQHQEKGSDAWLPGISDTEIAEHYQSKDEAQNVSYSYRPT